MWCRAIFHNYLISMILNTSTSYIWFKKRPPWDTVYSYKYCCLLTYFWYGSTSQSCIKGCGFPSCSSQLSLALMTVEAASWKAELNDINFRKGLNWRKNLCFIYIYFCCVFGQSWNDLINMSRYILLLYLQQHHQNFVKLKNCVKEENSMQWLLLVI